VEDSICWSERGAAPPSPAPRRHLIQLAAGLTLATLVVGAWVVVALASSSGPTTWSAASLVAPGSLLPMSATGYSLNDVSCPSTSLCVAVARFGNAVATTNPTGGGEAWSAANIDGTTAINSVSCPSLSLCVAADDSGNVLTSSDPAGKGKTWSVTNIDGAAPLVGVSCPSTSLCVAIDGHGDVLTSTNPTGGASAWSTATIDAANLPTGVTCPSVSFCVAIDSYGDVLTSTNPTCDTSAWSVADVDGTHHLEGVSCAATSLCIAVDYAGNAVISTNPTGGAGAWTATNLDGSNGLSGVSCLSVSLCVALGELNGSVLTSTNPTGGAGAWSNRVIDENTLVHAVYYPLSAISCPSESMCVTVDRVGNAMVGTGGVISQALTVSVGGLGQGTVTGQDISCPPSCSANYAQGTTVSLTARAAAGSLFAGWGGACQGLGPCEVTLDSDRALTATFTPMRTRTLTVSVGGLGRGAVRGQRISCPPRCSASYAQGTTVSLRATAAARSLFAGWGGACRGSGTCRVTLSADQAVTGEFKVSNGRRVKVTGVRLTRHRSASLSFAKSGPVASLQCALVRAGRTPRRPATAAPRFSSCHSPKLYRHLKAGYYVFYVRGLGHGPTVRAQRLFKLR
jgi:Divergent InlB B-repeat domain